MEISRLVQEIQYVIAPAVMVSSSALLLLGFQTKYSNLANRFRALNQEKRLLAHQPDKSHAEEARLKNLAEQVDQLMKRAAYVKNAILSTYAAIICFVGTSILLFLNVYASFGLHDLLVAVFLAGFLALTLTSVLMMLEASLFFRIIEVERRL